MTKREMLWRLEAAVVWVFYHLFRAVPVDMASAIGGWFGRTIGYRLPVTRHARRNLIRFFPDWSEAEREAVLRGMWDNLGRTATEYSHLPDFRFGAGQRVEVEGLENLLAARDDGEAGLFFSGHLGNWELLGLCCFRHRLPLHLIYRAATNPYVNWIYRRRGQDEVQADMIPKGSQGARLALDKLRRKEHLGMLVDQKMNDGIAVPFFGVDAMTAPALATFALKYKCPVVPAHIVRVNGAHFHITFHPPLRFVDSGDRHADVLQAMTEVNRLLEGWIRQHPEQWLWLHKRWPTEP